MAPNATQRPTRRAKAVLSDMITQEVSLVDAAANLRRWVVIKRNSNEGKAMSTSTQKAALKMPGTARQTIMDGLAQILDQLTGIATTVGDAEVDDAATVPPELMQALGQVGQMIGGLCDQFAATEEPAPAEGEPGAAAPPPPAEGAPVDETKAGSPKCEACGQPVTAEKSAELAKAGRKIKGVRLAELKGMSDKLASLIKELEGEETAAKACGGKEPTKKNADGTDVVEPDPQVAALAKSVATLQEQIAKSAATIEELKRTPGVSNARPVEGVEGDPSKPSTVWPSDMSASIAKKNAKK